MTRANTQTRIFTTFLFCFVLFWWPANDNLSDQCIVKKNKRLLEVSHFFPLRYNQQMRVLNFQYYIPLAAGAVSHSTLASLPPPHNANRCVPFSRNRRRFKAQLLRFISELQQSTPSLIYSFFLFRFLLLILLLLLLHSLLLLWSRWCGEAAGCTGFMAHWFLVDWIKSQREGQSAEQLGKENAAE